MITTETLKGNYPTLVKEVGNVCLWHILKIDDGAASYYEVRVNAKVVHSGQGLGVAIRVFNQQTWWNKTTI